MALRRSIRITKVNLTNLIKEQNCETDGLETAFLELQTSLTISTEKDRAAAEALRGTELLIDGGDAPALGEQEWWAHELEGCEVLDGGQLLGTVSRLIELPSCEALEVRPADGGAVVLVPMVKDAVRRVAPAQRRIEVDLEFLGLAERAGAHQ